MLCSSVTKLKGVWKKVKKISLPVPTVRPKVLFISHMFIPTSAVVFITKNLSFEGYCYEICTCVRFSRLFLVVLPWSWRFWSWPWPWYWDYWSWSLRLGTLVLTTRLLQNCSQWWTPPLGLSFPRESSIGHHSAGRSFVCCTGWRLQGGLHSNNQSSLLLVYKVSIHGSAPALRYWRALSGGRCRGSSAALFHFIVIIDCKPHQTPYCWWSGFPGRCCSCLEQSARSCHFRTFRSSLTVPG